MTRRHGTAISKPRLFLVASDLPRGADNAVVPLRTMLVLPKPMATACAEPRETSWRDLVRRLQKKLMRR